MASKDLVAIIDQQRVVEAKPFDAAGDLLDLLGRVCAGVTRSKVAESGGAGFRSSFESPMYYDGSIRNPRKLLAVLAAVIQNQPINYYSGGAGKRSSISAS